jgi:FAD/FMN-containing dehydrogenase
MVADLRQAARLAADAARPGIGLLAAEVVDVAAWRGAAADDDAADPLAGAAGAYILLVEVGDGGGASGFSDAIAAREHTAVGVDPAEKRALWRLREGQTDYWVGRGGALHKFDVCLPVAGLDPCVAGLRAYAAEAGGSVGVFGHIREGNLHLQLRLPAGLDAAGDSAHTPADPGGNSQPPQAEDTVQRESHRHTPADPAAVILPMVARLGGSISAEHGIGRDKAPYLHLRRSPEEIALMRAIKHAWDPHGILNPGVIFA